MSNTETIGYIGLTLMSVCGLLYAAGYIFARGFHKAGKHKTVCDLCWRRIDRINAALKAKSSPETLPSNNGFGGDKAPLSSGGSKTDGR